MVFRSVNFTYYKAVSNLIISDPFHAKNLMMLWKGWVGAGPTKIPLEVGSLEAQFFEYLSRQGFWFFFEICLDFYLTLAAVEDFVWTEYATIPT